LAIKTEDGIVLSSDRRVTYVVGEIEFSSENEKIVQIGKNTIMGFSGDLRNSGQLIELLNNNSKLWITICLVH
jgi:20S proteasome, alpha and beta subunits